MHTEKFVAHIRGGDEIVDLQLILLNKQQLVSGTKYFVFQLPYPRYSYCEKKEITFLWKQLSALNIKIDIRGAWKPILTRPQDVFLMEAFIDKGYSSSVLEVLNDIRVYMRVTALSEISRGGTKMEKWALAAEPNRNSKWSWPPRRVSTRQNKKVWRDCICGTFIRGIDDLLDPVTRSQHNCTGSRPFHHSTTVACSRDLLSWKQSGNTLQNFFPFWGKFQFQIWKDRH